MNPIDIVITLISAYEVIVIVACVLSFIHPPPQNAFTRFVRNVTGPVFSRVQRSVPLRLGQIDLSPLLVLVALEILRWILK